MSTLTDLQVEQIITACQGCEEPSRDQECKQKVRRIVDDAWRQIFTVSPLLAASAGLLLLVFILCTELFIGKQITSDAYPFLIRLSGALAAGAFAAFFTGAMNVDIKWLQAGGTMAVFALVFLWDPITTKQPATPANPVSGPTLPSVFFGINSAFAQTAEADNISNGDGKPQNAQHTVGHIRIYYPRGVTGLNEVAFRISRKMSHLAKQVDVYSLGSIFAAPMNFLRYDPGRYQLAIAYRSTVDKKIIDMVIDDLASLNMKIEEEDIESRPMTEDIAIFVRLL